MILLVVVGAGLALVALPGAAERFGRHLRPSEWTRLCAVALAGGLALLEMALLLRAAPTLLHAAGVGVMAAACERLIGPLMLGGPVVGWSSATASAVLPMAAAVVWHRGHTTRRRIEADLWLADRRTIDSHCVEVLPIERPFAVSFECPGRGGVIVATDGLFRLLNPDETAAVVRHEAAHLHHRHQRLLTLSTTTHHVLGWIRPVGRSASALHLAVERWADEEAAQSSPRARQALRDSLLRLVDGATPAVGVAGITDAATVVARIAALETEPPAPSASVHTLLYAPGAGIGLFVAPAVAAWGGQVQTLLAAAGRCPV